MSGKAQKLARARTMLAWIKGRKFKPSEEDSRAWITGFNMGWIEAKKIYKEE